MQAQGHVLGSLGSAAQVLSPPPLFDSSRISRILGRTASEPGAQLHQLHGEGIDNASRPLSVPWGGRQEGSEAPSIPGTRHVDGQVSSTNIFALSSVTNPRHWPGNVTLPHAVGMRCTDRLVQVVVQVAVASYELCHERAIVSPHVRLAQAPAEARVEAEQCTDASNLQGKQVSVQAIFPCPLPGPITREMAGEMLHLIGVFQHFTMSAWWIHVSKCRLRLQSFILPQTSWLCVCLHRR